MCWPCITEYYGGTAKVAMTNQHALLKFRHGLAALAVVNHIGTHLISPQTKVKGC